MKIKIKTPFFKISCLALLISLQIKSAYFISEKQAVELASKRVVMALRSLITENPIRRGEYLINKPVARVAWLPGYIIKSSTDRIEGAEQIVKPCIEKEKLNLIRLPKMWKISVPSRQDLPPDFPRMYTPKAICLAEYIPGKQEENLNLKQTEQLVTFITKAKRPYTDCRYTNIVFTSQGQLALIDTEIRGFGREHSACDVIHALKTLIRTNNFDEEALLYLKKFIQQHENRN